MSIFKKIEKGLKAFSVEINKPDSFTKGEEFEEYVRKYMFPAKFYQLVHRTHDYQNNKNDYVESSLLPDFKFRDLKNGKEFYIECKFRNGYLNKDDKVVWCNQSQLNRYLGFDKNDAPVFIALGFGDNGDDPYELSLFSIREGKWNGLYESFLDEYSFYLKKPVISEYLWNL